ncbi:bifunctional 5,10-methylenetetrahydrofolate dehydrogenase/5,10-methenyltetrahydrofolate cyclohydrolase [Candidatus Falkowbacteria bacterium]|nr:bifunctional 5,10-methylenetetrahydrofolate dehydrogenase/5,10-methenyltetrahydrofolate cyclohydrolase [Candidatus Falkowbacteria bacterium]
MPKNPAQIINGKKLADQILLDLRAKVLKLNRRPALAAILVGDDPASTLYIENKKKACLKVGINFYDYYCAGKDHKNDTEKDILAAIDFLNKDSEVDGIIVQLPIPKKFNAKKITGAINPGKDVDGLHPKNAKAFSQGKCEITPPLVKAVIEILKFTKKNFTGKIAVVVADSTVFSQPIAEELNRLGLKTKIIKPDNNLKDRINIADLIISIIGRENLITKDMVKQGATVIDVGTSYNKAGELVGDASPKVKETADFVTPVPGGIGPLTVAMLLENTYQLAKQNINY